jgi:hypothetical protein
MSDGQRPSVPRETRAVDFEMQVADLFAALGADRVVHRAVLAGQGVDLLVTRTGSGGETTRAVVQCKAFTLKVGVGTVSTFASQVENLRESDHVDQGIMVSLSGFTPKAVGVAKQRGIRLYTIDQLRQNLQRLRGALPDVKPVEENRPTGKYVFVLMPFDPKFDDIYWFGIRGAVEDVGFRCERADEIQFVGGVIEKVAEQIRRADIVVADMTGKNANVFYEAGIAHTIDAKKVALIVQSTDDIPFDLRNQNHVVYGGSIKRLRERLKLLLRTLA